MLSILISIVFSSFLFDSSSSYAFTTNAKMPVCMRGTQEIQIDNARVIDMKQKTANQYHDRGFVEGRVAIPPTVQGDHVHFSLAIGPAKKDTVEIIYNFDTDFGELAQGIRMGDTVVVCGDYITSNAPAGGYRASPDGALIHWTHWNPATRAGSMNHEHGFIMTGSTLSGFDRAPEGSWDGTVLQPRGGVNRPENGNHSGNRGKRNGPPQRKKRHYNGGGSICGSLSECGGF
ncbi:MAG: hypothetical protein H7301_12810 [Cryobacterium sp.]|nr:hypothetical protein [Oligoflexia bacterium]